MEENHSMPSRKKIWAGTFHVVGGGCFGSQYVRWLLRARHLGWLEFENIKIIDRNANCLWQQEGTTENGVEWVQEDWIQYFSGLLRANQQSSLAQKDRIDHWVPAPLSPHILFEGFLQAAHAQHPGLLYDEQPFRDPVATPVQIPLEHGPLAVSFAQWQCPVNCIEPTTCPAIHESRHWDMKRQLQEYFSEQSEGVSWHVLQCQHLLHGVGTIPMESIRQEYEKFLRALKKGDPLELVVATVSGCHGLVGKAGLRWASE